MAHYKRGKCRYQGKGRHSSETFYRKRHGLRPIKIPHGWWKLPEFADVRMKDFWPDEFNIMSNHPRAHDILFHTRPRRHDERRIARLIRSGRVDADATAWPLEKKPHKYYW